MIKLTFPLPPSVNEAYAGKDIRYKSESYQKWVTLADQELAKQTSYEIEGDSWLSIDYTIYVNLHHPNGNKRYIDTCNYEKCMSDFLGGYIDKITRRPKATKYKKDGVQRIPGFMDHKIIDAYLHKRQKPLNTEDYIEVVIREVD